MQNLTFEEFQEMLTQNQHKAEEENLREHLYHTTYNSDINTPICKGRVMNISVRSGITLLKVELTFSLDTTIEMKSFQPQVGFVYCLKGKLGGFRQNTIPLEQSILQYDLTSRKGMIYVTAASEGWMKFDQGKPYKAIYLLFNPDFFEQLVGDQIQTMPDEFQQAIKSDNGYFTKLFDLSSPIVESCKAIFDNPFTGKSKQFYREAKVIELIAHQINELHLPIPNLNSNGLKLTEKEEKKLEYCQQILLSSLDNPPSLLELAKELGMSDYRLKDGFKLKFGFTPYRFVAENRMLKAKELLKNGEVTVSEAARLVGFNSLGTFSNTFYEKFGVRPSELR